MEQHQRPKHITVYRNGDFSMSITCKPEDNNMAADLVARWVGLAPGYIDKEKQINAVNLVIAHGVGKGTEFTFNGSFWSIHVSED